MTCRMTAVTKGVKRDRDGVLINNNQKGEKLEWSEVLPGSPLWMEELLNIETYPPEDKTLLNMTQIPLPSLINYNTDKRQYCSYHWPFCLWDVLGFWWHITFLCWPTAKLCFMMQAHSLLHLCHQYERFRGKNRQSHIDLTQYNPKPVFIFFFTAIYWC